MLALHVHEFKMAPAKRKSFLPTGILKAGKTSAKLPTTSRLIGNK